MFSLTIDVRDSDRQQQSVDEWQSDNDAKEDHPYKCSKNKQLIDRSEDHPANLDEHRKDRQKID